MKNLLKAAFDRPGRLYGLDVARALALIGMIATHTLPLSDQFGNPEPVAVIAGKAAALFAVLAGFSVTLSTRKYVNRTQATASLLVRGVLIAFIGLVLGSVSSQIAVILVNYGVMFMLAPLVIGASKRVLMWLAPAWLVLTPVVGFAARVMFDIPRSPDVPHLGNYLDLSYLLPSIFLTGYYPVVQWFGYLLVGILLSRLDWSTFRTRTTAFIVGAGSAVVAFAVSRILLAVGGMDAIQQSADGVTPAAWGSVEAALATGSYGTVPTDTWWWLSVAGPHTSTPFDMVYTAGIAVAVIAACMALCQKLGAHAWVLFPMQTAGSMPLTLYSAHIVLLEATDHLVVHVGVLLLAAVIWKFHTTRPGPMEWGVSYLVQRVMPAASASAIADQHGESSNRNPQEKN